MGGSHLSVARRRRARTLSGAGGKRAVGRILAWADSVPTAFLHPFFCSFSVLYLISNLFKNSSKNNSKKSKFSKIQNNVLK
jgi:hypothetical protein